MNWRDILPDYIADRQIAWEQRRDAARMRHRHDMTYQQIAARQATSIDVVVRRVAIWDHRIAIPGKYPDYKTSPAHRYINDKTYLADIITFRTMSAVRERRVRREIASLTKRLRELERRLRVPSDP